MNTLIIDLLRHGEARGGQRFRGWREDPLTDEGWNQMYKALPARRPWSRIISSPLKRCADFARKLSQTSHIPVHLEDDLKEIHFGEWEGHTPTELLHADPERVQAFWEDPLNNTPPRGESLGVFRARVLGVWQRLLEEEEGRFLLVTHGAMSRSIIASLLFMPAEDRCRLDVSHACLSRIVIQDGLPRLAFHCRGA